MLLLSKIGANSERENTVNNLRTLCNYNTFLPNYMINERDGWASYPMLPGSKRLGCTAWFSLSGHWTHFQPHHRSIWRGEGQVFVLLWSTQFQPVLLSSHMGCNFRSHPLQLPALPVAKDKKQDLQMSQDLYFILLLQTTMATQL